MLRYILPIDTAAFSSVDAGHHALSEYQDLEQCLLQSSPSILLFRLPMLKGRVSFMGISVLVDFQNGLSVFMRWCQGIKRDD
jgi:hypothetical protein